MEVATLLEEVSLLCIQLRMTTESAMFLSCNKGAYSFGLHSFNNIEKPNGEAGKYRSDLSHWRESVFSDTLNTQAE